RHLYIAGSATEALAHLGLSNFQPAEEAVVETKNIAVEEPLSTDEIRIDRHSPNKIRDNVITAGHELLASSDVLYPRWTATINGKIAPLHMTNGAFRGMFLSPGTSQIVMNYRPATLIIGAIVSAFSIALLLAGLILEHRAGHRARNRE